MNGRHVECLLLCQKSHVHADLAKVHRFVMVFLSIHHPSTYISVYQSLAHFLPLMSRALGIEL